MEISPETILSRLLREEPRPTREAPRDSCGVYGLIDHTGALRYIGSTSESFYKRIHQRHRTGSEGMSHYFSYIYNTGRMWRDRSGPEDPEDAKVAKKLRNAFIADHCRAVWMELPDDGKIAALEQEILRIAPPEVISWNCHGMEPYDEPRDLVDETLCRHRFSPKEVAAVERQSERYISHARKPVWQRRSFALETGPVRALPPFPDGDFSFFALDVETANNDRASICQIGVACVRPDGEIVTWSTFVDPQTETWLFTGLHGIGPGTVRGAPYFKDILPVLHKAFRTRIVYQHSQFDRSAINAACVRDGIPIPNWNWRDSLQVARQAWPELNGNGGHGLARLKEHLGLEFRHHDAGEDARAAAMVVLSAKARGHVC